MNVQSSQASLEMDLKVVDFDLLGDWGDDLEDIKTTQLMNIPTQDQIAVTVVFPRRLVPWILWRKRKTPCFWKQYRMKRG